MKKILVTGSTGMLGTEITKQLSNYFDIFKTSKNKINKSNRFINFDLTTDNYNILKAASAEVMMMVLVEMYQLNQTRTFGVMTDKELFKKKIKALFDAVEERNLGDSAKVKGSSIFIIGKEGVIGKYGNASSKKQFVGKVRTIFLDQMYSSIS